MDPPRPLSRAGAAAAHPLQLNTPGDADGWIHGVVQSGLVLGAGGLAAIVAGPLAGGLALATDLLPGQDANAQDLGIVNVSANLGQLLGPVVGAGLIAAVGGFWLLFVAAAVFSVLGAALTAIVRAPTLPSSSR
ncbi:MAG TPA: hypothetical protein VIT41_13360 [Microlunatus sp.]